MIHATRTRSASGPRVLLAAGVTGLIILLAQLGCGKGSFGTPPSDATKTASGLAYEVIVDGPAGDHPGPNSRVRAHYAGWNAQGEPFDASAGMDPAPVFRLDEVIAGWTEVVQLMKPGDKWKVWIPAALAYGEQPEDPRSPAGDLVFEIELQQIFRN